MSGTTKEDIRAHLLESKRSIEEWLDEIKTRDLAPFEIDGHRMSIREIASGPVPSKEEIESAGKFYRGFQWYDFVQDERVRMQRPCLTVNFIQMLLCAAKMVSDERGEDPRPEEMETAMVRIIQRYADPQRLYNYGYSQLAEIVTSLKDLEPITMLINGEVPV